MKMLRLALAPAITFLLIACSPTESPDRPGTGLRQAVQTCPRGDMPEAVVCQFYDYTLKAVDGLPSNAQQSTLASSLSSELRQQLNSARNYQQQLQKNFPNVAPPFSSGALFSSRHEKPDHFEIAEVIVSENGLTRVLVNFHYEAGDHRWQDSVELTRENNRFVINDIVFQASENLQAERLSTHLKRRDF
ncbi:MAG: DUF3828 domain-containing protein [Moraxellaceae bacterium]|nr:DUF3828 domain-containing protein [Moraxellaceae bacterium]MDZ4385945.1 DUF3828 domain-containing protein [Moraxellaceae bacterium]